jgi:serine/threonine protein kinase
VSYDTFAVKEIKSRSDTDQKDVADHWAREVRAMEKMNKLDYKGHIVHFVTAFRRGNPKEHYLITEWADGGNLRNLWNARPNPKLNAATLKSVIGQLLGIAEALTR